MTPGLYVYGIVDAGVAIGPLSAAGVDGKRATSRVVAGDVAAVAGEVDLSAFEGAELERNVANPGWLEAKVRAHECVLDELLRATTVVPMRFGSIFSSVESLESMLTEHGAALAASLERVRGRSEWGVKVHWDATRAGDEMAASAPPSLSGRDYLLRKSAQRKAREAAASAAAATGRDVHAALSGAAGDAAQMTIRAGERDSLVVLNGAYLVRDEDRDAFMRKVEELQDEHGTGYLFEVTGPWPPYNFTSVDVAGPRS